MPSLLLSSLVILDALRLAPHDHAHRVELDLASQHWRSDAEALDAAAAVITGHVVVGRTVVSVDAGGMTWQEENVAQRARGDTEGNNVTFRLSRWIGGGRGAFVAQPFITIASGAVPYGEPTEYRVWVTETPRHMPGADALGVALGYRHDGDLGFVQAEARAALVDTDSREYPGVAAVAWLGAAGGVRVTPSTALVVDVLATFATTTRASPALAVQRTFGPSTISVRIEATYDTLYDDGRGLGFGLRYTRRFGRARS